MKTKANPKPETKPNVKHKTPTLLANVLRMHPNAAIAPPVIVVRRQPYLCVNTLAIGAHTDGIATNNDPIQAVDARDSPNTSSSSTKSTPNEYVQPSAIACAANEAATITQPQPPSADWPLLKLSHSDVVDDSTRFREPGFLLIPTNNSDMIQPHQDRIVTLTTGPKLKENG